MSETRRDQFLKRLSTVGFGARESIQVMLANVVADIRDQVVHKRFHDDEMDEVIAFHDQAEVLWKDAMATDPLLGATDLEKRLRQLLDACRGPLGQFERKIAHGVTTAEKFAKERGED
jgi:hypothetical protein